MAEKGKKVCLSLRHVGVSFGSGKKLFRAVDDVSFDIYRGEILGLAGESGSGKTTLGRAIVRLCPISAGSIIFENRKISGELTGEHRRELIRKIQMIFQDPMASLNERAKVDYIISEGLRNVRRNLPEAERRRLVEKAMRDVGLRPEFADRFPHEFSGGQRQRIGIARSLIMKPSLIIADEAVSALDVSVRAQVLNLLTALQRRDGLTCLFIAHDLSVMRAISDRIAVIRRGRLVELAKTARLFACPLHPYTRALLSAVPVPDPVRACGKRVLPYNPACHDYSHDRPVWSEIEPGHYVYGNQKELAVYRRML